MRSSVEVASAEHLTPFDLLDPTRAARGRLVPLEGRLRARAASSSVESPNRARLGQRGTTHSVRPQHVFRCGNERIHQPGRQSVQRWVSCAQLIG